MLDAFVAMVPEEMKGAVLAASANAKDPNHETTGNLQLAEDITALVASTCTNPIDIKVTGPEITGLPKSTSAGLIAFNIENTSPSSTVLGILPRGASDVPADRYFKEGNRSPGDFLDTVFFSGPGKKTSIFVGKPGSIILGASSAAVKPIGVELKLT